MYAIDISLFVTYPAFSFVRNPISDDGWAAFVPVLKKLDQLYVEGMEKYMKSLKDGKLKDQFKNAADDGATNKVCYSFSCLFVFCLFVF